MSASSLVVWVRDDQETKDQKMANKAFAVGAFADQETHRNT